MARPPGAQTRVRRRSRIEGGAGRFPRGDRCPDPSLHLAGGTSRRDPPPAGRRRGLARRRDRNGGDRRRGRGRPHRPARALQLSKPPGSGTSQLGPRRATARPSWLEPEDGGDDGWDREKWQPDQLGIRRIVARRRARLHKLAGGRISRGIEHSREPDGVGWLLGRWRRFGWGEPNGRRAERHSQGCGQRPRQCRQRGDERSRQHARWRHRRSRQHREQRHPVARPGRCARRNVRLGIGIELGQRDGGWYGHVSDDDHDHDRDTRAGGWPRRHASLRARRKLGTQVWLQWRRSCSVTWAICPPRPRSSSFSPSESDENDAPPNRMSSQPSST